MLAAGTTIDRNDEFFPATEHGTVRLSKRFDTISLLSVKVPVKTTQSALCSQFTNIGS